MTSNEEIQSFTLTIKGLGPVPGMKNSKCIFKRGDGSPFIATKPEIKKWMKQAVQQLRSQLYCGSLISEDGTQMEHLRQSLTALLPVDDCWTCIPEIDVRCELCPKGQEGADITIEIL